MAVPIISETVVAPSLPASKETQISAPVSLPTVPEPFPIFELAHRYAVYDPDTVSYIRRQYNICGVLIGSLPQAPQQNVFQGLPLMLMPEEARLLVEKGVARIVDDVTSHKRTFLGDGLSPEERRAYQAALRRQGLNAARDADKRSDARKKTALKQKLGADSWNDIPDDMLQPRSERNNKKKGKDAGGNGGPKTRAESSDETLFASPMNSFPAITSNLRELSVADAAEPEPYAITPTTSHPALHLYAPTAEEQVRLPDVPQSFPLFKHLHNEGYFLAPGLRFGCQYMAYPGDPLRFHSHFLVNGMDWDQEFDLLDLVGGGRLGTGVKKGFMVGGVEERMEDKTGTRQEDGIQGEVRPFCIEWGGM